MRGLPSQNLAPKRGQFWSKEPKFGLASFGIFRGYLGLLHKLHRGVAPKKLEFVEHLFRCFSQLHYFFSNRVRGAETVWLTNVERSSPKHRLKQPNKYLIYVPVTGKWTHTDKTPWLRVSMLVIMFPICDKCYSSVLVGYMLYIIIESLSSKCHIWGMVFNTGGQDFSKID